MDHADRCLLETREQDEKRQSWETLWPNHCPNCEGIGKKLYAYHPSKDGVSLDSSYVIELDLCPNCIEKGCCPRCGEQAWLDEDFDHVGKDGVTCPFCEWNERAAQEYDAEGKGLGMPHAHACHCWENSH